MKLLVVFVLLSTLGFSQGPEGFVFNDLNQNGVRDGNEPGIAQVAVSDQVQVVLTDANGKYDLGVPRGFGYLMISMPEGYSTVAASGYWKKISSARNYDFALVRTKQPSSFKFIHASDTHTSEQSAARMDKLQEIVATEKPDFVLISGDLVKDALRVPEEEARRYFELFIQQKKKITATVWTVPGNHEIFGIERHLSLVGTQHPLYGKKMYREYLGPNYFSFNYGGIHFIGLDDVDFEDIWYFGHVDSTQANWLRKDLAVVPSSTPVVTFKHMPFFSGGLSLSPFEETGPGRTLERENGKLQFRHVVSNAHELLEILSSHPYPLSLSGHFHARQMYRYESSSQNVRFEQTAAVVGPGSEGKLQFPSGITVYEVKGGTISEARFVELDK